MVTKYCEFQPSQHRNKRPAKFVFLDDEDDKFPMPICDVCSQKLQQMNPAVIIRDIKDPRGEKEAAGEA